MMIAYAKRTSFSEPLGTILNQFQLLATNHNPK